ncbi:MAG TPA: glycosyltransferase family 4 protein [Blastocatellia bacterium]|jgi:glycosyltransferase involved in cell wall biosynthesis|nr:glycosyltransferase family 4 protein [Blastocatellia bacterium]
MRILVISNFYPPHFIGGYELGCRDVIEELKVRGHQVCVLTSAYGVGGPRQDGGVYRWLATDFGSETPTGAAGLIKLSRKETVNRRAFKRLCATFMPDLIYAWNLTHVSISVIFLARRMGLPVCYYVSDHWLSRWESDWWYTQTNRSNRRLLIKLAWQPVKLYLRLAGLSPGPGPDLSHVQFASLYLKRAAMEANKPVSAAEVIHWGVDTDKFTYGEASGNTGRLLYVGQITSHKGVHTAVEALKIILEQPRHKSATLTVVGGPDYNNRIRSLVSSLGLEHNVIFTGLVAREELPGLYHRHDIFIFPSVWEEPFSIALLEALASGLAVVATQTGGSPEILESEVNALTFTKEDARGCAAQVLRFLNDAELFERVRQNGRRTVEGRFKFNSMVDEIERSLKTLVASKAAS